MWKPTKLNNGRYVLVRHTGWLFWRKKHYLCDYNGCPMEFTDETAALVAINYADFLMSRGYLV